MKDSTLPDNVMHYNLSTYPEQEYFLIHNLLNLHGQNRMQGEI